MSREFVAISSVLFAGYQWKVQIAAINWQLNYKSLNLEQSSEELFTAASENLDYSYRLLKYIAATTQQGTILRFSTQFWNSRKRLISSESNQL